MTAAPFWQAGDLNAPASQAGPAVSGWTAFRNLLGVVGAEAFPTSAPLVIRPPEIVQKFTAGQVSVTVRAALGDAAQQADAARKNLRKTFRAGPLSQADVAGYPGLSRALTPKKRGSEQIVQMYTVVGQCWLMLTLPEAAAGSERSLCPITLLPGPPPVMSPAVQIAGAGGQPVGEEITVRPGSLELRAIASPGPVSQSTADYAMASLAAVRARTPDAAVGGWQDDVFAGGWPAVRTTFLTGGGTGIVRSQHWWAGVVNGRGIQLFVSGTKSIISLDEARPLHDLIVLMPPD